MFQPAADYTGRRRSVVICGQPPSQNANVYKVVRDKMDEPGNRGLNMLFSGELHVLHVHICNELPKAAPPGILQAAMRAARCLI